MYRLPLFIFLLNSLLVISSAGQGKANVQLDISSCWAFSHTGTEIVEAAAIPGGVVIADRFSSLVRISSDGDKLWQSEKYGVLDSNLVVNGNTIFFVSRMSFGNDNEGRSWLREVSLQTGLPTSSIDLGAGNGWRLMRGSGNFLLLLNSFRILTVDLETRSRVLDTPLSGAAPAAFTADGNSLWTIDRTGDVRAIGMNGVENSRIFGNFPSATSVMPSGQFVAVGNEVGEVSSFRISDGTLLWKFRTGGRISHILNISTGIIVASHDNFIYAFEQRGGTLSWKWRLPGRASDVRMIGPKFAAAKAIDTDYWEIVDLESGKLAGRIPVGANTGQRDLLISLDEGFAVAAGSKLTRYSFASGGCPKTKSGVL